jgi:hypothetical protein
MPAPTAATQTVPVDKIYVGENVRDRLDEADVDRLAGSIALQGLIQPVAITVATGGALAHGYEWELVAGFTRYAAVCKPQHAEIAVTIRDADEDNERQAAAIAAARAAENIASCRDRHEAINADRADMPTTSMSRWVARVPRRGDVGIRALGGRSAGSTVALNLCWRVPPPLAKYRVPRKGRSQAEPPRICAATRNGGVPTRPAVRVRDLRSWCLLVIPVGCRHRRTEDVGQGWLAGGVVPEADEVAGGVAERGDGEQAFREGGGDDLACVIQDPRDRVIDMVDVDIGE